jgi:endonuclease YncB( thermonuclease family)
MSEAQSTEQKDQYNAVIKDYLNGLHHHLFEALTQTRNEQSKDVQARRVIEILLAQRMGK